MTVIALLNVENDPHIIADTLLTVDGSDPNALKSVWLPSVGQIPSERGSAEEPWYIARLGRKTFFLPNHSGVIAFAGHCGPAFRFWAELSAHIMNLGGYQPDLQVDRRMLEQALRLVEGHKLFLLGWVRDRQGEWEVFTHNRHTVVPTQSFGTCYLAGTGTSLLAARINECDHHAQASKKSAVTQRIGATENLAEGLSSDMLYAESDHPHGLDGIVSTYSCGGFYEWYRLVQEGVRKMPSRLDIHVTTAGDDVVITRLYLIDPLQQLESKLDPIPNQKYAIQILSVVSEPTLPSQQTDGSWSLSTDNVDAVLIESTFELYDTPEKEGRISGPVSKDFLEKFFEEPVSINRIRMICSSHGSAASRSISRLDVEPDVLATASFEDGLLNLSLSVAVAMTAGGMMKRLQEQSMPRKNERT